MKMFKASVYGISIVPVDVDRMSDSSVWIKGRRHARSTDYDGYCETFEDARAWIVEIYQRRINALQMNLDYYQGLMNKASKLAEAQVQS